MLFGLLNHRDGTCYQLAPAYGIRLMLRTGLTSSQAIQKKSIEYIQSNLSCDSKIEELIDWENKKDILEWLDSL